MADNVLFDKLAYLDRLTRAGMDEQQARALSDALDEALKESVATKRDIADLRHLKDAWPNVSTILPEMLGTENWCILRWGLRVKTLLKNVVTSIKRFAT